MQIYAKPTACDAAQNETEPIWVTFGCANGKSIPLLAATLLRDVKCPVRLTVHSLMPLHALRKTHKTQTTVAHATEGGVTYGGPWSGVHHIYCLHFSNNCTISYFTRSSYWMGQFRKLLTNLNLISRPIINYKSLWTPCVFPSLLTFYLPSSESSSKFIFSSQRSLFAMHLLPLLLRQSYKLLKLVYTSFHIFITAWWQIFRYFTCEIFTLFVYLSRQGCRRCCDYRYVVYRYRLLYDCSAVRIIAMEKNKSIIQHWTSFNK